MSPRRGGWAATAFVSFVAVVVACPEERARRVTAGAAAGADTAAAAAGVGAFYSRAGVLYGRTPAGAVALVAVYGEGPARDTLPLAWPPGVRPQAGFMIGDRIAGVAESPDGESALFWTSGVHSLVATVRLRERGVRVLDFLLEATPVEASWAPSPRYVALVVATSAGLRQVRIYDLRAGERLVLPWEAECAGPAACSVVRMGWEGGTLLTVELKAAEDEVPVPYEVDVAGLAAPDTLGEEVR